LLARLEMEMGMWMAGGWDGREKKKKRGRERGFVCVLLTLVYVESSLLSKSIHNTQNFGSCECYNTKVLAEGSQ
jgi:hypothetical protein